MMKNIKYLLLINSFVYGIEDEAKTLKDVHIQYFQNFEASAETDLKRLANILQTLSFNESNFMERINSKCEIAQNIAEDMIKYVQSDLEKVTMIQTLNEFLKSIKNTWTMESSSILAHLFGFQTEVACDGAIMTNLGKEFILDGYGRKLILSAYQTFLSTHSFQKCKAFKAPKVKNQAVQTEKEVQFVQAQDRVLVQELVQKKLVKESSDCAASDNDASHGLSGSDHSDDSEDDNAPVPLDVKTVVESQTTTQVRFSTEASTGLVEERERFEVPALYSEEEKDSKALTRTPSPEPCIEKDAEQVNVTTKVPDEVLVIAYEPNRTPSSESATVVSVEKSPEPCIEKDADTKVSDVVLAIAYRPEQNRRTPSPEPCIEKDADTKKAPDALPAVSVENSPEPDTNNDAEGKKTRTSSPEPNAPKVADKRDSLLMPNFSCNAITNSGSREYLSRQRVKDSNSQFRSSFSQRSLSRVSTSPDVSYSQVRGPFSQKSFSRVLKRDQKFQPPRDSQEREIANV